MTKSIHELMQNKDTRLALCKDSLYLFGLYYFGNYFTYSSPEFHKELCLLLQRLDGHNLKRLVLCAFRDSAKTSWAKIDFTKKICYKQREYMLYGSKDKNISQDALLDISLNLQTNKKIIKDFGQLFFDTDSKEKKSKKTGVNDFLTTNGVRCRAITTGQSPRGLQFNSIRPDHACFDDFENNKTKKSSAMTREVIEHFDELMSAMASYGTIVFCCNKISDTGSVAWLYDKLENNKEGAIFEKAVIENGEITWPSRFVHTDKESVIINENIIDPKKRVISLESKKRVLNKDGRKVYEQEMLNQPIVDGERFFDIELIDARIEEIKDKEFVRDGNWKIWKEFNGLDNYKVGADVSEGYGLDSSVGEVLNIDTGEQVAEYESSLIAPGLFADELVLASQNYGDCTVTPERNSIGNAVIASMQEKGHGNLLTTQKVINSKTKTRETRYGWLTNGPSKPKMLFDFQSDFNNGYLIINSLPLLREMRAFTNGDLKAVSFDEEVSNHFDRVMAMAITNQAKNIGGQFAISKKKVNIGTNPAITGMDVQFKGGKFRAKFKH